MTSRHRSRTIAASGVFLLVFVPGCSDFVAPDAWAPSTILHAKGGNSGGSETGGVADIAAGDLLSTEGESVLASRCPGAASPPGWAVVFGKTGCLIVTPNWASTTYEKYALTDDLVLDVQREKGKNGRITHVRLKGQDVDGEAGIWHNTDWVAVAEPVVPSTAGFTLHVHARNVQVWRYDSHLGDGNRVDMIGTITIGDVVYRPQ